MPRADLGGITKSTAMRRGIVAASAVAVIATGPITIGASSSAAAAPPEQPDLSTTQQFAAITADFFGPLAPARQGLGTNPSLEQDDPIAQRAEQHPASRAAARPAARARPAVARNTTVALHVRPVVRHAVSRTVEHGYVGRHHTARPARRAVVHAVVHTRARSVAHRAARPVRRAAAGRGLAAVVGFARAHVGHSYGGNWDCSGFVRQAYARIGINLPHSAAAIAGRARSVSRSSARPGDLIVGRGHVGIYMGGGMMIDAGNSRVGVSYRRMYSGLWTERLV